MSVSESAALRGWEEAKSLMSLTARRTAGDSLAAELRAVRADNERLREALEAARVFIRGDRWPVTYRRVIEQIDAALSAAPGEAA